MPNSTLEAPQVVIAIPLAQIRPNANNPRRIIHPETVERLAASMKAVGQETPIKVRRVSPQPLAGSGQFDGEPTANSQTPSADVYELIGGHRRLMAAQSLGWESMSAIVLDIAPGRVRRAAFLDNESEDMHWLDKYQEIEGFWVEGQDATPKLTQQALADELGVSQPKINAVLKVIRVLNAQAREAIYHTVINLIPGFEVTERPVLLLADLESPELVEKALGVLIQHKLTLSQVPKLVEWLKTGNSPESFNPVKPAPKGKKSSSPSPNATPLRPMGSEGQAASGDRQATVQGSQTSHEAGRAKGEKGTNGTFNNVLWKEAAGISMVSQIKAKLKKGEALTLGEKLVLAAHSIAEAAVWTWKKVLHPLLKLVWHVAKKAFHLVRGVVKGAAKMVGKAFGGVLDKLLEWAMVGLVIALGVWVLWNGVINHVSPGQSLKGLAMWPVAKVKTWIEPKRHEDTKVEMASVPVQGKELNPNHQIPLSPPLSKGETEGKKVSPTSKKASAQRLQADGQAVSGPVPGTEATRAQRGTGRGEGGFAVSSQAWDPREESRSAWESEAAALPLNARVKGFSYQPDKSMGGTMAESRFTDLGNSQTTFLMQGRDRHKILSAHPDSVNFTLASDAGLGGLLGEKPKLSFYWEDVKALHCDEVDLPSGTTKVFYQCAILLSSQPQPIVFQCATAQDLEHLVSALEFYVRASGHPEVPIGGLPYPNQGMLMGNQNQVTALWAQSPADSALVNFGDYVWSVKYSDTQQNKSDLEAILRELPPGNHSLYVVTPAEWRRAVADKNAESFNPARRRVELVVP